jgi:hypothetical protein
MVAAQESFDDERFEHPQSVARLHLQLRHEVGGRQSQTGIRQVLMPHSQHVGVNRIRDGDHGS